MIHIDAEFVYVVVPFYNEESNVERYLNCLKNQVLKGNNPFHLVLVDNNSSDNTVDVINKWLEREKPTRFITYITKQPIQGVSAARQMGFDFVKKIPKIDEHNTLLISNDIDCVIPPTYIQTYIDKFNDKFFYRNNLVLDGCHEFDLDDKHMFDSLNISKKNQKKIISYLKRKSDIETYIFINLFSTLQGCDFGMSLHVYNRSGGVKIMYGINDNYKLMQYASDDWLLTYKLSQLGVKYEYFDAGLRTNGRKYIIKLAELVSNSKMLYDDGWEDINNQKDASLDKKLDKITKKDIDKLLYLQIPGNLLYYCLINWYCNKQYIKDRFLLKCDINPKIFNSTIELAKKLYPTLIYDEDKTYISPGIFLYLEYGEKMVNEIIKQVGLPPRKFEFSPLIHKIYKINKNNKYINGHKEEKHIINYHISMENDVMREFVDY